MTDVYIAIDPDAAHAFATTLRNVAKRADSVRQTLVRGLALVQPSVSSQSPAACVEIQEELELAARIIDRRADLAESFRLGLPTDPALIAEEDRWTKQLSESLVDDHGVSIIDVDEEHLDTEDLKNLFGKAKDYLEFATKGADFAEMPKHLTRAGFLLNLKIDIARTSSFLDDAHVGEYIGKTRAARRAAFLADLKTHKKLLKAQHKELAVLLNNGDDAAALTKIGQALKASKYAKYGAKVGKALGWLGVAIGIVDFGVALKNKDVEGAATAALTTIGSYLMLTGGPVGATIGAILVAGVFIYENWDWFKRNLSWTGLKNAAKEIGGFLGRNFSFTGVKNIGKSVWVWVT